MLTENFIHIKGARVHNLKNVTLKIPRNKLTVITGLSGSGKSSLAFDTIHAEGQRRYMETFSAYVRQFMGNFERPDVDKIEGLSPVIAIEQKTTSKNPRSTVGTITEIYDFLRLMFSRIGVAYSYNTKKIMVSYTHDKILSLIKKTFSQNDIIILAPIIKSRKGHYRELFQNLIHQGFLKVRVDGQIISLTNGMKLDRYKTHDIDLLIDRFRLDDSENKSKRLNESLKTALYHGEETVIILNAKENKMKYYSKKLMCPESGISYPSPEPNTFSFNSPKGMCNECKGLGFKLEIHKEKVIPDTSNSIANGGIAPLGKKKDSWVFKQLDSISKKYGFSLNDRIKDIPNEAMEIILNGGKESFKVESKSLGLTRNYLIDFEGIEKFILNQYDQNESSKIKRWAKGFMIENLCSSCKGSRISKIANNFLIDGKSIFDISRLELNELFVWLENLKVNLNDIEIKIASELIKELRSRVGFLLDVGLDYLSLNRSSKSLSGGESQRIRLATQIGSKLVGVLYILDEPSIGLHQKDNNMLIESLIKLKDLGNTVIVVEHDKEMIESADHIVDLGPSAGVNGGEIVAQGNLKEITLMNTLTSKYLNKSLNIEIPKKRRNGSGKKIILEGCTGNNLKRVELNIPLSTMIGITGVSGSGKSSLINETLYPILNKYYFNSVKTPLPYSKIDGLKHIDKVIDINQDPIGRTPRSNPATYTGVYSEIRLLFSKTQESLMRGYLPGRFSFNVVGGRCETCGGGGTKIIEMNFLPDVHVNCESCFGKRFNRETLEIKYRGKSISDILSMTISEGCEFFKSIPKIYTKLKTIKEVGLGYIKIGQSSTTLSGGEAQRVKLASELSKRDTGNTLYILDEPTTGLHFEDIRILLNVLNKLVDKGNTVIIIEHNLDVIKQVDYLIDLGPGGGKNGGKIIAEGTPEEIIKNKNSLTGKFLKKELELLPVKHNKTA